MISFPQLPCRRSNLELAPSCRSLAKLGPIPPAGVFDPVFKVADQPADDVPTLGPADFDVPLHVDPNQALGCEARGLQFGRSDLVGFEDRHQLFAGKFDETHGGLS